MRPLRALALALLGAANVRPCLGEESLIDRDSRTGARVEESLGFVTAQRSQPDDLIRSLDSLGDDAQIERVRHAHHCSDDCGGLEIVSETVDERLVDLQLVEWESFEVRQR